MKVTVVAGNPKPESRTLDAAHRLANNLTEGSTDVRTEEVDVVTLGAGLLGWGDPGVAAAVETVGSSDLVVVASPTFKATYTGLLKLFLDQFAGGTGLQNVVVVPLMLGAGPAHAMAPDLFLKHVLVELGATTPAPGLYLIDSSFTTDSAIADYTTRWGETILASTRTRTDVS
ncbi:FMN reductase [Rhodococcoides trifolii]|uniref:FMN reductase n=1 Tax=Rhodococcoides trifolii TaxID=908250 RepID=A0A917G3Q8_9NOCA|nr:NAD(P)H-dependent oxidoreductase [Rhodococcus trifolii]GGG21111.1 FMN reductase [Rhodococcus trifolii]